MPVEGATSASSARTVSPGRPYVWLALGKGLAAFRAEPNSPHVIMVARVLEFLEERRLPAVSITAQEAREWLRQSPSAWMGLEEVRDDVAYVLSPRRVGTTQDFEALRVLALGQGFNYTCAMGSVTRRTHSYALHVFEIRASPSPTAPRVVAHGGVTP